MRKKIRVVQFGVGPIGASILRLMRQKHALEIVGAIDKDPAKAGRDIGEVAGAKEAPWGIAVSSSRCKRPRQACRRGRAHDLFLPA